MLFGFLSFFSGRKDSLMRKLTPSEQPHRLISAATTAQIAHGETARATVENVNLVPAGAGHGREARFCDSVVKDRRVIVQGDNQPISNSTRAFIQGDHRLRGVDGYITLEDALITSNGRLVVAIDSNTRILKAGVEMVPTTQAEPQLVTSV